MSAPTENLRMHLRLATAAAHDLLDASMREASGWTTRAQYIRFLGLQYAARQSVEAWLEKHAPSDLLPPSQTVLIAADLAALDATLPPSGAKFEFAQNDASAALGIGWSLAGSSLGNRAILKEVTRTAKAAGHGDWPQSFLGDDAMLAFWGELRRRIERPASEIETQSAAAAAEAVFNHFTTHTLASPPSTDARTVTA